MNVSFKQAMAWLSLPGAFLAYSLIRGPIVNWYPYPFLDPGHGYVPVAITSLMLLLMSATLACVLAWMTQRAAAKAGAPAGIAATHGLSLGAHLGRQPKKKFQTRPDTWNKTRKPNS